MPASPARSRRRSEAAPADIHPPTMPPLPPPTDSIHRRERAILFLVGAVQFINVLDFMMVMPLGPDFAAHLGIPTSHLGYIGGSYVAAAAVAGLLGGLF